MMSGEMFKEVKLKAYATVLSSLLLICGWLLLTMADTAELRDGAVQSMVEISALVLISLAICPLPPTVFGKWRVVFEVLALSWLAIVLWPIVGMVFSIQIHNMPELETVLVMVVEMLVLPLAWILMGRGREWLAARCMDCYQGKEGRA